MYLNSQVVLVRQICRQERIELLLRNAPHDIGDFTGNLLGLHANMAWQVRLFSSSSLCSMVFEFFQLRSLSCDSLDLLFED